MSQGPNLVLEWLSKLHLAQYVESFLDNGYDDLEVCKQIGQPDLDAIGVHVEYHRHRLLAAVQKLKDGDKRKTCGYYFTLEPLDPSARNHTSCPNRKTDSRTLRSHSGTNGIHQASCPGNHDPRVTDCNDFVTYPKLKLKVLIRDKLAKDGINLGEAPYTFKVGNIYNIYGFFLKELFVKFCLDFRENNGYVPNKRPCDVTAPSRLLAGTGHAIMVMPANLIFLSAFRTVSVNKQLRQPDTA